MTRQRADEKAKYRKTPDGKLLHLPSTRTHQYLRGQVLQRPEQFRAEIDKTGGTPKQRARREYLRRLIANLRPNVMRQWDGSTDGPASVMTRQMTNDERQGYGDDSAVRAVNVFHPRWRHRRRLRQSVRRPRCL